MKKIVAVAILAAILPTACVQLTKEDYLQRYKELVERVQENHKNWVEKDWQKADDEFSKINDILKKRFDSELTAEDKITMSLYSVRYNFYRNTGDLTKKITDYVENDLKNDVEDVIRKGKDFLSNIVDSISNDKE